MDGLEHRAAIAFDDKEEVRIERAEGKAPELFGYAIRFNSLSKDLGGFRERIMPSAVDKALTEGTDVRALIDHNASLLLGRTSAGTLRIGKDDRGLWFRASLPDTQYARDLTTLVDRGDIRGMSFGFRVPVGGDKLIREGDTAVREVNNMDLREITVTSIPAYPDTSVGLRSDNAADRELVERAKKLNDEARAAAAAAVADKGKGGESATGATPPAQSEQRAATPVRNVKARYLDLQNP